MKITGFLPESFQDWNGLCSIIFTGNCNYNCPACYAGKLVKTNERYDVEEIVKRLERKKNYIDKVVICGGEATLQPDLERFLERLKKKDFLIKLDTNGSNPFILEDLILNNLVDYVAMDIKGPPSLYRKIIGVNSDEKFDFRDNLTKSIGIVQKARDYEFRTTLFPVYSENNGKEVRWMTKDEAKEMVDYVKQFITTNPENIKWYVQKFTARNEGEMIDKNFAKENLPEKYRETPEEVMNYFKETLKEYFPKTEIR